MAEGLMYMSWRYNSVVPYSQENGPSLAILFKLGFIPLVNRAHPSLNLGQQSNSRQQSQQHEHQ